ncbi:MAG: ferredoxin family protein [Deltaproteobacteria bacterium]|nr:ferredoxin family protein [Deltaproteobacteria bacterium]
MTYIITEPCIDVVDTGCIDICPMDCIHGTDKDKMLYIDPEECIDCGGCVPPCPANAIFPDRLLQRQKVMVAWKTNGRAQARLSVFPTRESKK